ncbi:MAG: alpha/beta fold hydrolase [Deltaproteobacteria bacterium]|jgi:cis-3-alkyl-4-acyloxetan-2-one decarboxylase|nr:alpha/beta fold hydrolase [Deltaproteobacteria bacterium]
MVNQLLYPFKSHFLNIQGLKYHYIDVGKGDPVLMLHGNPTWSFYYRHLISALKNDYHVIAPDHIGCGLSDKPGEDAYSFTLKQRIEDLEQLVDHLSLDRKITLVLHDWGGMIGMGFAVRNPEKISRLIITNTAAFHLPENKSVPFVLSLCRDYKIGAFLVQGLNAFSRGAVRLCCHRHRMPGDVRQAYLAPYNNWHNRLAVLKFVQGIPLITSDDGYDIVTNTQNNLSKFLTIPTLILWGAKDFVFDDHFLSKWQHYLPQASVHRFSDAGHYLLEDAHEEITPLIKQFLLSNPN